MVASADNPDAILGKWLSSKGKNQVQIYKQGGRYFGRMVWMAEPNDPATNKPKTDRLNPDVKLRSRPLMHLTMMTNLRYKGNNVWTDGQVYNPEDGRTYGCELTLRDANSLDISGYVMGLGFLKKTRTWTRVK
ncbi:SIGNAL peptide protein [Spirosoma montaniterrae]|uniref:SIGNAL peptide protein n=2 Tax=Spirosoma montaniterrae TaxID=1178516 RepID=A0A1P9X4K1_9BACT|nr:SIGNAL peptide protein [Spirosoma montaniterrae]